jgi:ABC-type antimicrobial peptide transport system permease subunit
LQFKQGDIVRLKETHKSHCPAFADTDLVVVKTSSDLVEVKRVEWLSSARSESFFDFRLELAPGKRVEGQKIKHKDIKAGDTILNTVQSDDLTLTRQGVVEQIGSGYSGSAALWTADNKRIDIDMRTDSYTLVKAAPEEDFVLKPVVNSKAGAVVQFPSKIGAITLARKSFLGNWDVYFASGVQAYTNKDFADLLRPNYETSKVRWLS